MAFFYSSYKTAVLGDPSNIIPVYAALGAQFKAALGPVFSSECEEHYRLMFCGLFANDSKPYGQSVAYTMEELCAAPVLDCDNYLMFTWRLFDILCPPAGRLTKVAAWGMDKGFIGNHAMLWAQHPAGYRLLADPTVALFQIGSGFGYDPLFVKHGYSKSFGELEESIKNRISHREKAFSRIIPFIQQQVEHHAAYH